MAYTNKYTCTACLASQWALCNPLQCARCYGNMELTLAGTTDVPSTSAYERHCPEMQFNWDEFEEERERYAG